MAKMAELHAGLTELPDEVKDYMQGFFRGRAEGKETERERIIKLLENSDICMCEAIALIKGENK